LTLAGHTLAVERVLFAPGGDWLVSLGLDKQQKVFAEVKVWDAHTGKLAHAFAGPASPHTDIAFNRSPTVFAVTAPTTPIALYDADKGQQPNLYGPYWGGPATASPGAKVSHRADQDGGLVALTASGTDVWETRWPDKEHTGPGVTNQVVKGALPVIGLQLAAKNNRILVFRPKIGMDIWTVPDNPAPYSLVNRFAPVQSPRQVAIHPDGKSWALALGEPSVTLWHFPPGVKHKKVLNFEGVKATVTAVAFSPIGHALAATNNAGNLLLWESSLPEFAGLGKK
jgi:WD40 repeat protein